MALQIRLSVIYSNEFLVSDEKQVAMVSKNEEICCSKYKVNFRTQNLLWSNTILA
jgi:hypothetical protein